MLNTEYSLKESTTIESNSVFHIYKRKNFIEEQISGWHSVEYYDGKTLGVSEFDSIKLFKVEKKKLLIGFYRNKEIKIDTFNIQNN